MSFKGVNARASMFTYVTAYIILIGIKRSEQCATCNIKAVSSELLLSIEDEIKLNIGVVLMAIIQNVFFKILVQKV